MQTDVAPLLLDPRVGSRDLSIQFLKLQHPFEMQELEFGDVAFTGYGPNGLTPIGIERKNIRDLVQSLTSNRLVGHQLPGLVRSYDFRWLIVEGAWRANDYGCVEVPRGGGWEQVQPQIKAESLVAWLISLQMFGGLVVWQTHSAYDTARSIAAMHQWWAKPWDEHRSHVALYHRTDLALFTKPTLLRRWAAELPNVGVEKSKLVEQQFASPYALATAGVESWLSIKGIGKLTAQSIIREIRNE